MKSSREQMLGKIRKEIASVRSDSSLLTTRYAAIFRGYIRQGELSDQAKITQLVERLRDYDAEVVETTPDNLVDAIRTTLLATKCKVFAAPIGLPRAWMIPELQWKVDEGLTNEEINDVDGVITTAFCAVADSGTIVLHHTAREGRRVLTLLPDRYLCILYASQVVQTLPEYFSRVNKEPTLVTWISGPSATADIEMTRIKGVHGPRYLNVILVQD
jgi:L-lactate dehydrogenase complex protein LldG